MSFSHPHISIIIPAKNEASYLPHCLSALKTSLSNYPGDSEIIVVDNNSSDDTAKIASFSGCRLIKSLGRSIASARNDGANQAKGSILSFLDADCLVAPDWAICCVQSLTAQIAIVGTSSIPDPQNSTWVEHFYQKLMIGTPPQGFTRWIATANLFVSKTDYFAVGGFDESLTSGEDVSFCNKIRQLGKQIKMLNNPVTIHLRESKTVSQLIRREFQRGKSGLYSLIKSSDFAKDLPSIALPMAFLISQFLLIIMPFYSIKAALIPLISIFLFPLPIFFVKKPQCNTMHDFLACYLIAMFYIFARSASLFCELLSLIRCIHFTIML